MKNLSEAGETVSPGGPRVSDAYNVVRDLLKDGCDGIATKRLDVIFIALGANLPGPDGASPSATCAASLDAIAHASGLQLQKVSRWYLSDPHPPSDQPPYCNGVALYRGQSDPGSLLAILHAVEAAFGRTRGARNAARTLDLDIIDMDGRVRDAPVPILPHPRAHLRPFVLVPLAEIAPGWRHPRLARTVEELLAGLPRADLVLL